MSHESVSLKFKQLSPQLLHEIADNHPSKKPRASHRQLNALVWEREETKMRWIFYEKNNDFSSAKFYRFYGPT